jgi:hypothetical protein
MDPISALILAGILTTLFARTVGSGVTDAIASSKGETPPSLEKWRKRQADRKARGEAPEKEPGPWRRRWRNAVEHRSAKAAQKHAARMEHLRDNGPGNVAKHKARLAKRAERWDKINDTAAKWGSASWDAAKNAAKTAKDRLDERRAWNENERRDQELVDPPIEPVADTANVDPAADTSAEDGPDAQVIPLRPNQDSTGCPWIVPGTGQPCGLPTLGNHPYCADHCDVARIPGCLWGDGNPDVPTCTNQRVPNHPFCADHLAEYERNTGIPQNGPTTDPTNPNTDTNNGGPMTAPANTATEITDLDTAISYSNETAKYTNTVSSTLSDIVGQIDTAAQGLEAEAAQYEQAKANLVDEGFGAKVTSKFDTAAESLHLAAEALKTARDRVSSGAEQVTTAGDEMRSANKVFSDQLSVQESVGAAKQDAGVSKRTDFYSA